MTEVVFRETELRRLLLGSTGPVAQDIGRRAVNVESQAKLNASGRPGPRVDTGRLRSSIAWKLGEDAQGVFARIGSNVEYARFLELGTPRMQPYPFLVPALSAASL